MKNRLQTGQGLSFTEFSYQLLQAYDFFILHSEYGCSIQLGGSDQWGNIVGGIDLIRRRKAPEEEDPTSVPAYGITMPLLTTPSGEKFGKSAGNAVWLDDKLTSVFDFYQVWLSHLNLSSLKISREASLTQGGALFVSTVFRQDDRRRGSQLPQIIHPVAA